MARCHNHRPAPARAPSPISVGEEGDLGHAPSRDDACIPPAPGADPADCPGPVEEELARLAQGARSVGGITRLWIGFALRTAGELTSADLTSLLRRSPERIDRHLIALRRDRLVLSRTTGARTLFSLTERGKYMFDGISAAARSRERPVTPRLSSTRGADSSAPAAGLSSGRPRP